MSCYFTFLHPVIGVCVVQSGGLRTEIGVLYLSHAMLVLAELIVCSTRECTCILAEWFWPTVTSLSLLHMEVPRPHVTTGPTHTW